MSKVDPFIRQIPEAFRRDVEVFEYFTYFTRWAHDMWVRSGSGDDLIDEATNINAHGSSLSGSISGLSKEIDEAMLLSMINHLSGQVASLRKEIENLRVTSTVGPKFTQQDTSSISTQGG